jgi:hypothetical protein
MLLSISLTAARTVSKDPSLLANNIIAKEYLRVELQGRSGKARAGSLSKG